MTLEDALKIVADVGITSDKQEVADACRLLCRMAERAHRASSSSLVAVRGAVDATYYFTKAQEFIGAGLEMLAKSARSARDAVTDETSDPTPPDRDA